MKVVGDLPITLQTGLKKIVRLPSPDRPNVGGADSKYFIGPLKAKFF